MSEISIEMATSEEVVLTVLTHLTRISDLNSIREPSERRFHQYLCGCRRVQDFSEGDTQGLHFLARFWPSFLRLPPRDACTHQPDSYDAPQLESFAFPLQSH